MTADLNEERLAQTVEKVAESLFSERECVPGKQGQAVGAEGQEAYSLEDNDLGEKRNGGAEGDRTPDLMNAIHALSQLSYSPTRVLT